jgi:hypothetical protein
MEALTPNRTLLLCAALVASSTAAFPWIQGYGMVLAQFVVLGSWGIVAALASGRFADLHHSPIMVVALFLNLLLFMVPAGLSYWIMRHRWPRAFVATVSVWCIFYVSCLFFLFPATDGP